MKNGRNDSAPLLLSGTTFSIRFALLILGSARSHYAAPRKPNMRKAQTKGQKSAVELPPDIAQSRLLDSNQAAALLGFSLAHLRRLYRAGKTPRPVKINGRKVGWPASQLLHFIAARAGEGD